MRANNEQVAHAWAHNMRKLGIKFSFAGFDFPRYIPELKKIKGRSAVRCAYYHAPAPLEGVQPGGSFYLGDFGAPARWVWCDDVEGVRIDHTGWFIDDFQSDTIRGLVIRLAHGRFLAGWSMGEGMLSSYEGGIYTDERTAAYAAERSVQQPMQQSAAQQRQRSNTGEKKAGGKKFHNRQYGGIVFVSYKLNETIETIQEALKP